MSYSICFECSEMVSLYEKYCPRCVVGRTQIMDFWKTEEAYRLYADKKKDENNANNT